MRIPLLQVALAKGAGDAVVRRLLAYSQRYGVTAARTLCKNAAELVRNLDVRSGVAESIVESLSGAQCLLDRLTRERVEVLYLGMELYPERLVRVLGRNAPPVLYVRGNVSLLTHVGVGFCGSRHSSVMGLETAAALSKLSVQNQMGVVSGYAGGVDTCAHCAALRSGGSTVFVLAEGILNVREKLEVAALIKQDNHLFVSQFPPECGWYAHNAMRRNHLIVGLSDAMVVIEAGATGGTMAAGEAALQHGTPLFVVDYRDPPMSAAGNAPLIVKGGRALRRTSSGEIAAAAIFESARAYHAYSRQKIVAQGVFEGI